jgi:hypothetical protein
MPMLSTGDYLPVGRLSFVVDLQWTQMETLKALTSSKFYFLLSGI